VSWFGRGKDKEAKKPKKAEVPEFFEGRHEELDALAKRVKFEFKHRPELFKEGGPYSHRLPPSSRKHLEEQRLYYGFYTATRAVVFDWMAPEMPIGERVRNTSAAVTYLSQRYFKLTKPKEGSPDWEERYDRYLDLEGIIGYGSTRINSQRLLDASEWADEAKRLRKLAEHLQAPRD
jgi:hypothetical protein